MNDPLVLIRKDMIKEKERHACKMSSYIKIKERRCQVRQFCVFDIRIPRVTRSTLSKLGLLYPWYPLCVMLRGSLD